MRYFDRVRKTEYEVISQRLPKEFDGFKIAHISDTHSRPAGGISEITEEEKPNIIVMTGDMVHDDEKPISEFIGLLDKLLKIAPVYMVTGNHDEGRLGVGACFAQFSKMGACLLNNERVLIEKNGAEIALCGVRDPFSKLPGRISENLEYGFSCLPEFDGYKILLFHRANLFDEIKNRGYDLILSGHMHGGQIKLPHFGGVLAPSSSLLGGKRMIFPKYSSGSFEYEGTTMLVNCGAGNTLPVPRLGNPPEVGIVTLRRKF